MKGKKVVLTVAHLDHDASAGDHSPGNLKAYCQACHLRYDGAHRRDQMKTVQDTMNDLVSKTAHEMAANAFMDQAMFGSKGEGRQQYIDEQNLKYLKLAMSQYDYKVVDNEDGTYDHTWEAK